MTDARDLPIVAPGELEPEREATVAGVLLAAGTSSRFGGENKLLATVDGEPMIRLVARTLCSSRADPVVVVVGYQADRVRTTLADLDVEFALNESFEAGQSTSVRAGVRAVRERADAAVFALGDMPRVAPQTVNALIRAYRAGAGDALAAAVDGRRGNPVLFDARHFDALERVEGDRGGRAVLFSSDDGALVETGDPGVRHDVDTDADLDGIT